MEHPPEDLPDTDPITPLSAGARGATCGAYRLLEKIGEGGMGEVWRAQQSRPLQRIAAVKIIKRGMDTDSIIARFEAERQALALMDHPFIAKVFDGGATDDGRPYFAMEFVRGIPITDYCDEHKLSIRERLKLFEKVCVGVQHAHQKAVIHRDLKPRNILVAEIDGKPEPKIIDFGVAKATTQPLTERTLFTELGQAIGTPEYMSPEQAGLTQEGVDTRTDIYSLGVILYELLVGSLPFEPADLRRHGYQSIVRFIREQEPTRPSLKLTTLGDRTTDIAANRQVRPLRLRHQLQGDLDWIVLKTLEKDRNRRYATPEQLAADIDRHLLDLPVVASPPSAGYRLTKFVRRHSAAVAITAVVFVLLVAFSTITSVQAKRIAREARYGREISDFLTNLLVELDPLERGSPITLLEIVDEGARRSRDLTNDQPLVRARVMLTIGTIYRNFAHYREAVPLIREAVRLFENELGAKHSEYAAAVTRLASTERILGHFASAESLFTIALPIQERELGAGDLELTVTLHGLAVLYRLQSRFEESEAYYHRILDIYGQVLDENDPKVAKVLSDLAVVYFNQGNLDAAEANTREALLIREATLPADHASLGESYNNLGVLLSKRAKYEQARDLLVRALAIRTQALGPEHADVAQSLTNLGMVCSNLGDHEAALVHQQRALDIYQMTLGKDHLAVANVLSHLAGNYLALGRLQQSRELAGRSLRIREASLEATNPLVADAHFLLARIHVAAKSLLEAEACFQRALTIYGAGSFRDSENAVKARNDYADLLAGLGRASGQ